MQAIVCTRFGPPEGLQLQEIAQPVPKDNELLIRVEATSVFAGDAEMRSLRVPLELRLPIWIYMRFVRAGPLVLGQELAGVVEAVGGAVTKFKPGDAVYAATGFSLGAYAEYICLPEGRGPLGGAVALKPANLSFAEAATIPVGGLEALHFIRLAKLERGQSIVINGAGGSIGTMAIQLAKLHGAEVTAVDSADKLARLASIGADHTLDYAREDFTRTGQRYDVILDVVGKSPFGRSVQALKPNGRYLLGNPGQTQRLRARWTAAADGKRVIYGTGPQRPEDLAYLKDLLEAGQLKPVIDRTYALEQMAEAHRYVDSRRKQGNVAVTVAHPA